jgi:putative ABC transport system permease protein
MKFTATAALALGALARNKLRSLLTTLGIVIGVGAVITMQAMGQGATAYVSESISGLGSNILIVIPGASHGMSMMVGVPLFTAGDMDAIRRDVHAVDHLAAVRVSMLRAVAGSNNRVTTIAGTTPEYFDIRSWPSAQGRLLTQEDERNAALNCVIGQTIADLLFPGQPPLGRELRIRDLPCRVVGVLEAKGGMGFGSDQDDIVLMPFSTFGRRIAGNTRIATLVASAVSTDRIDEAKREITSVLRARRHVPANEIEDFTVRDPRELQVLMERVTSVLTSILAGVASISLLVGGIGIMNIMLVSVTERTREIGVRLAVGARAGDILMQFMVEAVVLSSIGGLIGIGLGVAVAQLVARGVDIPFVAPVAAIPLALAVSIGVGVVFGVVPARKAARLNPLAALRFE